MAKATTSGTGTKAKATKKTPASKTTTRKRTPKKADSGKAAPEYTTDATAPGKGPVTISATEARASEPVMADEQALAADTPPPASRPAPHRVHDDRGADAPTSGAGDYVGDPDAPTGQDDEAEFNAAATVPSDDAETVDGVRYEDVKHPRSETERMEKREIELGADMDYAEHRRTYAMFMNATKYGTAIVVALLVAMAIGFFIAGSFLGGIVVFVGAALAAIWFLR